MSPRSRVHIACPLSEIERQNVICSGCPLPPKERYEKCSFYQGQINVGVPWKH